MADNLLAVLVSEEFAAHVLLFFPKTLKSTQTLPNCGE
jgi:hypothetical protein